ncbi:MAG TPA: type II secretion system F family protein [Thermomicrobiales bacterium]|nr:type II secretion system F family protein [Thermomicrobiales bacterium]
MDFLLPFLVFGLVFLAIVAVMRRSQRTVTRLNRHEIAAVNPVAGPAQRVGPSILANPRRAGSVGALAAKLSPDEARSKSAQLLLQAGSPMPLGTFLLLRAVFTFVLMPLGVIYMYQQNGISVTGIGGMAFILFAFPKLPMIYIRGKARKRAKEVERAMPDALDLLVVCVEGGLSLDGGIQQVANRTEGLLGTEFRRLLGEMSSGMARRDALRSLASRSMSQSLGALCNTIIQADKMGVSIGASLRTLAETLRTKRRQEAETQARKAPIKMLPFIIFFMLPAMFVVILGPTVIAVMEMFKSMGS